MSTAKPSADDLPILDPADTMFHSYSDRIQQPVKFDLLLGQLTSFGFLKWRFQAQARHLVYLIGFGIDQGDQRHLLSQSLVAFIRFAMTPIWQPFHSFGVITQFFVAFDPRVAANNRFYVMVTIGHKLSFAGKHLFLPEKWALRVALSSDRYTGCSMAPIKT